MSSRHVVGVWVLLTASSVFAAPGGELDATFGENGRVTIQLADYSIGLSVAQQADGKLLIGGTTWTTSVVNEHTFRHQDFAVVRLKADGTRDNSFGRDGNGVVTVDFFRGDDVAVSFVVQPDRKILLAGRAWVDGFFEDDLALARLNPDGSLDKTFGGDGRVTLDLRGYYEQVSGTVLLDNQKIVVAGFTNANGDYDVVFARFNADGSLDASFGTSGTTLVDNGTNQDQAFWLTRQPDGKFIACGWSGLFLPGFVNGAMLAVRANEDGSVDTTYGTNGVVLAQTPTVRGQARSCVALRDGSGATILAGAEGAYDDANLAFARIDASGRLDSSFATAGHASIDLGGWEVAEAIALLNDGKLAVAGLYSSIGISEAGSDMFLARIDADTGMLDSTFGNAGVTVVDFGQDAMLSASVFHDPHSLGLIQQTDGKVVAVGTQLGPFPPVFAAARVDPAGTGNVGVAGFTETSDGVTEGMANVLLSLSRTGGSVGELTIDYAFVAGTASSPSDFTGVNGSVTWGDGDVADKTITIPITDDTILEDVESFGVTLSTSSTAGLAATEAEVAIGDNDAPVAPVLYMLLRAFTVREDASSISLPVVRIRSSVGAVSVDYATSSGTATAGTDFVSKSGTLTWADGDTANKTIVVNITNDTILEDDETFIVTLSNPSGGASLDGSADTVTVTIAGDDGGGGGVATVAFGGNLAVTISEAGEVLLKVVRSGDPSAAVSVNCSTSSGSAIAGSDFLGFIGSLSWAPGDMADKTCSVGIVDDDIDEDDETFTVALSSPSGGAVLGSNSSVTVTITDDDAPAPPPPTAPPPSASPRGSGGGGSSDGLLLGLLLLGLRRQLRGAIPRPKRRPGSSAQ
jgi:uncharacterized delta-60 repeat protein